MKPKTLRDLFLILCLTNNVMGTVSNGSGSQCSQHKEPLLSNNTARENTEGWNSITLDVIIFLMFIML